MKNNPKISVVIRTKNEGVLIGKVLKSLHNQTHKNMEIIVVDSESTDKTLQIAKKYKAKVIKVKTKDYTPGYGLNVGINSTKGEYVAIICGHSLPISDEWLFDGLLNFKDKKVATVTGWVNANPIGYINRILGRFPLQLFFQTNNKARKLNKMSMLIRKNLWKKYPFNEKLKSCEDRDWCFEMISKGYKIVKDKKFSVFHSSFFVGKTPSLFKWVEWIKVEREINNKKKRLLN